MSKFVIRTVPSGYKFNLKATNGQIIATSEVYTTMASCRTGIAKYYKPEELIGKTLVAITNLPPRKMMGKPSCGMVMSAVHTEKGEEKLNLIMLDDKIPAGAKLC